MSAVQGDVPLVFLGYAREDKIHLKKLDKSLAALKREGKIKVWSDLEIGPGDSWNQEVIRNLDMARIALFLVSLNFMDSCYSWEVEVSRAIEREARGDNITVIPIIVSECDWKHTPLGERQGLPRNGKPITEWQQRDKAWTEVAKEIRKLVI